jgi:hypothetical protein
MYHKKSRSQHLGLQTIRLHHISGRQIRVDKTNSGLCAMLTFSVLLLQHNTACKQAEIKLIKCQILIPHTTHLQCQLSCVDKLRYIKQQHYSYVTSQIGILIRCIYYLKNVLFQQTLHILQLRTSKHPFCTLQHST